MATWERRVAQRQNVRDAQGNRLASALRREEPLPDCLPECCRANVWLNGACDHEHHEQDIFAAYAVA